MLTAAEVHILHTAFMLNKEVWARSRQTRLDWVKYVAVSQKLRRALGNNELRRELGTTRIS